MNKYVIESLKHWFRMRRWVREEILKRGMGDVSPTVRKMHEGIGEIWIGADCSLCQKYYDFDTESCGKCPLFLKYGCEKRGSPHDLVDESDTWNEWYENSKGMIKALWEVRHG